jgi:MFS family permease
MAVNVLRDRHTRILFAGQSLNMLGNTAMIIVLAIWVKDLTDSNGAAGLIFLLLALSSFFAPLTGMMVDRFPRRRVLIVNDVITGLVVLLLLTVHHRDQVWIIYAVTVVYGFSGQVYRAARGGLLHSMVPAELLGDANGLFSSLGQGLRIIGPLAGAAVYATAGGGVVAVADTGTFAVSVASYLMLRDVADLARPEATGERPRGEMWRELAAGARHVLGNSVILRLVLASAIAFTGAGLLDVAVFALVDQGLHRSTSLIGVLGAVQGVGSVIAGFAVGPMIRRLGEYFTASIGFLLNGVGLALAATATLPTALISGAFIGLGLPLVLVAEITLLQRRTPAELQGRAITASDAIVDIPFSVAIAVGAGIIGSVGFRPIYIGCAISFTLVGLALLPYMWVTRPEPAAEVAAEVAVEEVPQPVLAAEPVTAERVTEP